MKIPFNKPHLCGHELDYISHAHSLGCLAGDGHYSKLCHKFLEELSGSPRALLTHSCTAALEMQALLADIKPGDEVIMPSYTFVSTANAVVLRGGVPVFVDIREDTLNIDETLIEEAISSRTRAIAPVHYAGVACEMDTIMELAKKYSLLVIEDAAQAYLAKYKGKLLGTIGDLGAISFHETKNVISGEGGALLVNNPDLVLRSEIIREKGTDRSRFFRGEVDKYTWQDYGSSYLPGELVAAFLWAQLQNGEEIIHKRRDIWNRYYQLLAPLADQGLLRLPIVPEGCKHNGHIFYILLPSAQQRSDLLASLKKEEIFATFHYVPLHSSPAGKKYAKIAGSMEKTEDLSSRLIRLPIFYDISPEEQERIAAVISDALSR